MKKGSLQTTIVILLLFLMGIGCERGQQGDKVLLELTPDSKNPVIQNETEGIEFKFCLLNEQGIPSTIFNEKENFILSFSFKNNLQNTISVNTEFINYEFYRVYRYTDNKDMGKPWTGVWCNFSGLPKEIDLLQSSIKNLNCPWVLTEYSTPDYPLCMSESKSFLDKGDYFTSIELDFHYKVNNKEYIINKFRYRINFRVQ